MKDLAVMLASVLLALMAGYVLATPSDVDQADMSSDSSGSNGGASRMEGSEGSDPNLLNPQKGQGYGMAIDQNMNNPWKVTTQVSFFI